MIIDVLLIDKTGFSESSDYFEQIAQEVFTTVEVSFEEAEISVLLTDDDEIADLNEEYRDKEGTTDVLSFPMSDDPLADGGMLGDVAISITKAEAQADENEITLEREVAFLFIHGLLHLLGYDHETSEEDEEEMFDLQENILYTLIENGIVQ